MSRRWSAFSKPWSAAAVLAATGLLAACGDDATGPSTTGSVQAYVADDDGSAPAAAGPEAPSRSSHGGSWSGSLDADAQVSISAGGDVWIDLGPASAVSLALQASDEGADVHGSVEVPAGVYTRVRLTLTGAQARLNAGGTVGAITLSASTTLSIGANGTVVVEREVPPFEVRADAHTSIHWDVNSHLWVHEENVQDEEVEEQEVDDASHAHTVAEPRDPDMK